MENNFRKMGSYFFFSQSCFLNELYWSTNAYNKLHPLNVYSFEFFSVTLWETTSTIKTQNISIAWNNSSFPFAVHASTLPALSNTEMLLFTLD